MPWIKPEAGQSLHIQYGAHTCRFSHAPSKEIEDALRQFLAYESKDASFAAQQAKFRGGWGGPPIDPKRYLYNRRTREFPTGLIDRVQEELGPISVVGHPRSKLDFITPVEYEILLAEPRYYQVAAWQALVEAGRGVAVLPTGTGKTLLCAMLASSYRGRKVLVTTPNKRLLHQNREEMERFLGQKVGILGDTEREIESDVIVSTIQSLVSRIEAGDEEIFQLLTRVDVWICDESHGAASDSYRTLSRYLPNTFVRFGTTATWIREDGCELIMEGVLGSVVYEYTYENAFADEYLTPIRIWVRGINHDVQKFKRKPNYSGFYKQQIVQNDERNLQVAMDAAALVEMGLTPCLVMVKFIEHGDILSEYLQCPFVNGEHRTKAVDKILEEFLEGKHPVIVASSILNVGVNLRPLRSAVNAAGGDSRIEALQKPGRGLRTFEGKEFFDYIDYNDREPNFFREHSANRRLTYKLSFPRRLVEIPTEKPLSRAIAEGGKPKFMEDF